VHDDDYRNELILRGQARVLAQHTYQARARKIVTGVAELVERHLQKPAAIPITETARSAHA
jgi:hypothetical protein